MKLSKKSQMEMIGLVVIVILITLGMLFMATFAFKKEPKGKSFKGKELAYSTMGALMKTSVKCEDPNNPNIIWLKLGGDLIADCAKNHGDYLQYSNHKCDGEPSCVFLKGLISNLLSKTLKEWGRHYEFNSTLLSGWEGSEPESLLGIKDKDMDGEDVGCLDRAVDVDSSDFPLPVEDFGLVENVLYLCD